MWIWHFIPHCSQEPGTTHTGCILFGIDLKWVAGLTTLTLIGSFFAVPIGLIALLFSQVVGFFEGKTKDSH
jgi:hypothetical protein